MDNKLNRYLGT